MHKLNVIPLGLGLLCFAGMLQAQELPDRGPIPFAAYDKDKSGTISKDEFYATRGERMGQRAAEGRPLRGAAQAPAFEDFDTNGDGQLSEAELTAGQRARAGAGRGPGAGQGGTGRNMPAFADYDLNGDGKLTEQEFGEARSKRIEERVREGGQMRNLGSAPTFADIDANGDKTVTPEEFAAHQSRQRGGPGQQ